jgi:hypothetical protein
LPPIPKPLPHPHAPPPPTSPKASQPPRLPASEIKATSRGQIYLGFYNDLRDLGIYAANTNALYLSNRQAATILNDLHERNTALFRENAISREEWERSLLNRNLAVATSALHEATFRSLVARFNERALQMQFLKGAPIDIDKLYSLYVQEWKTQCIAAKKDRDAADAQFRMAAFQVDLMKRAREGYSYFDWANAQRDLAAARAELSAKRANDEQCPKDWPTREEIEKLMKPTDEETSK